MALASGSPERRVVALHKENIRRPTGRRRRGKENKETRKAHRFCNPLSLSLMLAVSCFFFLWLFSFVEWHSSIGPLDEENPKETNRGDAFTLQKLSIDLVHTSTAKKKSSYKQRNDLFFELLPGVSRTETAYRSGERCLNELVVMDLIESTIDPRISLEETLGKKRSFTPSAR